MKTEEFKQRTALVTGGNRGIGLEIGRQLARSGYGVVLGARDGSLGLRAVEELAADGLEVRSAVLDVTSDDSVAACAAVLARDGIDIDILVNNAGILVEGGFVDGQGWEGV